MMFMATIAVSCGGWLGRAMVNSGMLNAELIKDADKVFIHVAKILCHPGVFGFVMAALTAALMSTADTLINATSAVVVNDLWRPFIKKNASDKHYLRVARVASIAAALIGMALVPLFNSFKSIYQAHGGFTAMITPPVSVALCMAIGWRRFGTAAAMWTIGGGTALMILSVLVPEVIIPFSFGVERGGELLKAWSFQRACYGVVVSGTIGLIAGLICKPPEKKKIVGLVWGTIKDAMRTFKGSEPNMEPGPKVKVAVQVLPEDEIMEPAISKIAGTPDLLRTKIHVAQDVLDAADAKPGDLVIVEHPNWIWAGLRAVHAIIGGTDAPPGSVRLPADLLEEGSLTGIDRGKLERLM